MTKRTSSFSRNLLVLCLSLALFISVAFNGLAADSAVQASSESDVKVILSTDNFYRYTAEKDVKQYILNATIISDGKTHNLHYYWKLPKGVTPSISGTDTLHHHTFRNDEGKVGKELNMPIEVEVKQDDINLNYTWSFVFAYDDSDYLELQDTFSVPGINAYNWEWGKDNYGFTNSDINFSKYQPYYVSNEDLYAFKTSLSKVDCNEVGSDFGAEDKDVKSEDEEIRRQARISNFLNNKMTKNKGSCYGMVLTAAMFKTNMLNPAILGGSTTHNIPFENVKSMINVYHMSQSTHVADGKLCYNVEHEDFNKVADKMYSMGLDISNEKSDQQPFLLSIYSTKTGDSHAVLCYGAESGSWTYNHTRYSRRLLIADPNKKSETYLYFNAGKNDAVYSGGSNYNCFGYRPQTLSDLNGYAYYDMKANTKRINTYHMNLLIKNAKGQVALVGRTISNLVGKLRINLVSLENELADSDIQNEDYYFELEDDMDDLIVMPTDDEGNVLDKPGKVSVAVSTPSEYIGINGIMKSVELHSNNEVDIEDANGDVSISITDNDSPFDFVLVTGKADGDVHVCAEENGISISGNFSDYTISNMDLEAEVDDITVHGDIDSITNFENEKLESHLDTDNNQSFDTTIDSDHSNHKYSYEDNGDGTHTAKCILGDSEYEEAHTFVNGICDLCGAKNTELDNEKDDDKSSIIDKNLNGIVKGPDGKWAMYKDGKVDTSFTSIAKNQYGWWRVKDGYVDFNAQGIYQNEYGWWKTTNGKVTFNDTGIFQNEYGWWRVKDSKVDFKAQGIYQNKYGWWKTTNGKVTFKENGVFQNEYGWWKVKDSKVDFNFTGIASNKYGKWYIKNGKVDFSKNGKVIFNNRTYIIKTGKVQE